MSKTKVITEEREQPVLRGYFPNQKGLINCIDEIHFITDNNNRTDKLDEKTPFDNQSKAWFWEHKKKKSHSNKFDFDKAISRVQILKDFVVGKQLK